MPDNHNYMTTQFFDDEKFTGKVYADKKENLTSASGIQWRKFINFIKLVFGTIAQCTVHPVFGSRFHT